jgi:LysM repeat protein
MSFLGRLRLSLATALLVAGVAGCLPSEPSQQEEEKEPHFVLGSSRVKAMDYEGAVEAFEESLEVNPHSAAAHYELGCLFEANIKDPAAAIYHYQQYLKYDPTAENAQIISQNIETCKRQLAQDVLALPSTSAAQQQLEHLVEQNRQLLQQIDQLQTVIKQWNAYYASQQAAQASLQRQVTANPQPAVNVSPTPDDVSTGSDTPAPQPNVTPAPGPSRTIVHSESPTAPANSPRTSKHAHTVQPNETLASIARKSSVSLSSLLAANPGLNPKKLHVGQSVVIP